MNKKYILYGLILIETIIQTVGSIYYDSTPKFVWTWANAIMFLVPLLWGLKPGLVCLIPAVVSEFVFFFSYHIYGPLLHAATFTITTIVLGLLHNKLKDLTLIQKIVFNTVLVLASLILEELLYRASIAVFLHHDAKWASVIEPFQSPVNIILLIGFTVVLTYLVYLDKDKKIETNQA
ncbi:MAG: hypothetical protein J6E46_02465 [Faecalicoccus sp.]|nr:hypothetical protein [Faecalicoccus sp.]